MFSSALEELTGRLDSRFILTLFFPSLLFWTGLGVVYSSEQGLQVPLKWWQELGAIPQLLVIIGGLAWVLFFAYLLGNQLLWITGQYEGFWEWIPFVGEKLVAARKTYYQDKLTKVGKYETIYYRFPFPSGPDEVLPTRLGNVMKNTERYPWQRYDLAGVLMWPRLYAILRDRIAGQVDSARTSLDFMIVISALSVLFAVTAGICLLLIGGTWWLFVLCFGGGFLLAYLAYLSALGAAVTYGEQVKSAYDLYRNDLRQQLGLPQPDSLEEERAMWQQLYELIYRGEASEPDLLRYKKRPPPVRSISSLPE